MSRAAHPVIGLIRGVEETFARDVTRQRRQWQRRVDRGRVWFDREVRQSHKCFKQSVPAFLRHASLPNLLTTPLVYSLVVPFLLLDLWATIYQWTCFPIYGIARVRRRSHFVIDRHKLAYLNLIEKANCMFCGYANGVIAYLREIGARTEQYWCPIKHSRPLAGPHSHYRRFFEYGDAQSYRSGLGRVRTSLAGRRSRPAVRR